MTYLTALTLFGLITLVYLLIEVGFTYAHFGKSYGFSSNRPADATKSALGLRINRAFQNQIESAAYIVPVLVAAHLSGLQSTPAEIAAAVLVIGRAAFGPLYFTGIPFIRIPAWGMGWISTAVIAVAILQN